MTELTQPAGHRLKRMVRLGGAILVLVMVFLTGAGLYLHSEGAAERARSLLESQGSRLLGEELILQRLEVDSVLPPGLTLRGVSVHSRATGLPLASVAELRLALDQTPRPWERRIAIRSLELVDPSVRLALVDGQPRDFAALVKLLRKPRNQEAALDVQLGSVLVRGGSLRLSETASDLDVSLDDLALAWEMDIRGDGSGNLGIGNIDLRAGELRENGALKPFNFEIASRVVTLRESSFDLSALRATVEGEIGLPAPPRSGQSRPLTYALTLRGGVDLPKLGQVLPTLPKLEGKVEFSAGLSDQGQGRRTSYSVQGHEVLVHLRNTLKPQVLKVENPSVIGYLEDGKIVIEEESVLLWGGGRIEPEGWILLKEDYPFDFVLGLNDIELERALDSSTVVGSWVALDLTGTASLKGHMKGGFVGRGRVDADITDLYVRSGAWDSPKATKQVLYVPRARLESGLYVDKRHLALAPSIIRGPRTKLAVSTKFLFGRPLGLDIEVQGKRFDIADLSGRISGARFTGDGRIEAHIVGPSKDLDITGRLELENFAVGDWPFGRVAGDVHWHARSDLEFTSLHGQRGRSDFESEVRLLFPNTRRGGERRELELAIEAVVPEGHGHAEDLLPIFFGGNLGASGPVWGSASLTGPPKKLSGRGEVRGANVDYLWESFSGLEIDAVLREGVLDIQRGWASKPSGNGLAGSGWIAPGGDIDFDFELAGMNLSEMAPVAKAFVGRSSSLVELAGGGGAWLEGRASGRASIEGSLKNIEVRGVLKVDDFNYRGSKLGDSDLKLSIADHLLEANLQAFDDRIVGGLKMATVALWRFDYELAWADFGLTPFLPRTILGQSDPIQASMTGRLEGEGTLRDGFHHAGLRLDRFSLHRKGHVIEAGSEDPVRIGYRDGAFRFDNVRLVSPSDAAGRTDFRLGGFLRPGGSLDLDIKGALDLFFIDFAYDVFDRAEAERFALDLKVAGRSTSALEIEGSVVLEDALLKTIYFPHAVEVKSAEVDLRDHRLTVRSFVGELGGGALEDLAGSYVLLDRSGYQPRSFGLKANCLGCTVRYPDFLPPASGDLRLQFAGTAPDDLHLTGQVHIDEMVLRDPLNWQRSVLSFRSKFTETLASAERDGLFDIDLLFDSEPGALRIHNNVGDLRGTARQFRVAGDTQHVVLEGSVEIDGGSLPYSGHKFQIEPGYARFRDSESWFPEIDLRMWTDIVNREETYRITYAVTGPLDSPKLRARAEPQLAEADINLLLLFGLTQEQLAEADLGDVVLAAGGAGLGTLGESTATTLGQTVAGTDVSALVPDRIEIVPVYTDTTGATTVWTVATKEIVPGLLTLEGGFGVGTGRNMTVPTVLRAKVGFQRNVYLEGSWLRDDASSRAYGNFGLDLKFEVDID